MQIYVGNIPLDATDADLRRLFAGYGAVVAASVSIDGETDRSLGFGLVELVDDGLAHTAVQRLNGSSWNGRTLAVNGRAPAVDVADGRRGARTGRKSDES